MSPKMRSIFAQVYQKSVSMGRTRNFSSSPTNSSKESKNRAYFVVTRTLGFVSGNLIGYYLLNDLDKILERRLQEDWREAEEKFKTRDEDLAYLLKRSYK